jgi:hypothetical protein
LSDQPYWDFLGRLGITKDNERICWWRTELGGWCGGESENAKGVDVFTRRTYQEGFYPITDVPDEYRVTTELIECAELAQNSVGGALLSSWSDYYCLRQIPDDSPVALLLTFPLTLYYAIQEYGEIPCTVARMLRRSLRIHVVGAEKEVNFVDVFKEVAYLLPQDLSVELVFVVRQDMLPPALRSVNRFSVDMTDNLQVILKSGTYGDSLDPNFDCGSGPPDMIIAFNAGLYAYESWRSVVAYLEQHRGCVGVFTDYNEFSGVQCASLGGASSRESVRVNPFRQPRAMPVYSMNLPQFSNGFLYVFNEQSSDI